MIWPVEGKYIELNRKSMVYASRYNANAMDRLGSALGFGTGNDLTKNTSLPLNI